MYYNIIKWAIDHLGTMADDDYHKKLGEMQKYVPFLETTIKRLKSEKDKPREAQISKLQSLLVILTDSKKKLKLDALKKCEEVILKLYDKVEKKPPVATMHKYMCRTPPEEKQHNNKNIENKSGGAFDSTFLVARQKLKQTDATPASPSPPPLEQQINICKPVVIPTEKITTNIEPLAPKLQNPQFTQNWENYQNIPQTLNWPVNAFNPDYPPNMNQVWQDPNSQNWTMPPSNHPTDPNWAQQQPPDILYKRRTEPDNPKKKDIWDRETLTSKNYKHKKIDREIINYSDALSTAESKQQTTTQIKIVGNNKEIIPIKASGPKMDKIVEKPKSISRKSLPLPPAPQSRKSLEKEILPLNKPPLTDRDLQDLLSPVTESSSGGHSPIFNEDMDLDKLEELKAKLCKELAEAKPKHKKKSKDKDKIKSPTPVPPPSTTTTTAPVAPVSSSNPPINNINKKPPPTKVIKEPNNVFGSLLSSIDEQIMGKNKDKKLEKKDCKKEEASKKTTTTTKEKDKKETPKETTTKVLNIKDVASMNDKIKSMYLKSDNNKPKDKKKSKEETAKDKKSSTSSSSSNNNNSKDVDHKRRKSIEKPDKQKEEPPSTDNNKKPKEEFKIPLIKSDDKTKDIVIPKEIDDKVFKTVEDIMKNLKESINKPVATTVPDPLSKFGDLVKEKSDQLCDNSKPIEIPPSGRLSDKYPHKRKSIDSRASDSPLSDTNVPKIVQEPIKLSDPRLRNTAKTLVLSPPPMKEIHFEQAAPNRNIDFDLRNNKAAAAAVNNPEFSFQSSYNNMNNPNHFNNNNNNNRGNSANNSNIFCNEPPSLVRPPNEMHHVPFQPPDDNYPNPGCRTPGDPFIMHAGPPRTPGDPFLNPVDQFINAGPPRTPGDPFLSPGDGPFMNQGRGPGGPDQFHNFNQFPPNNQFRNDFPMNMNHDRFNPQQNQPQNPNWNRGNQFGPPPQMCGNPNQYDLSQMNPIDFYDNNNGPPEFNNPPSFRGRGNCNMRGNFGARGRGGPPDRDRNPFRDPRQFRNKPPQPGLPQESPVPPPPSSHKDENRRSRFDEVRDSRDHRSGDRDYRRSRFGKEEERPRSSDDRYNRFGKREEPVRKPPTFAREDPRRKSIDEQQTKEATDVAEAPKTKETKEEIQSPLDSLYSTETKRVGKGYGLQSFKIPKIKKVEETKEDVKTTVEEVKEDKVEEEPAKEEAKPKEETVGTKPEEKDEIKPEAGTSTKPSEETKEPPKTEADLKLDMFNNFMKHIFETCDSSVLFQYLDRCGFSLPNAKTKRIRRIIDSDSSDTEDEHRKEDSEPDKPTPEPPAETPETPEPDNQPKQPNEPEKLVETVSERIKSRRRKPVAYSSSDSSPDKNQKKETPSTPEKEEEAAEKPPKQTVKTQAKTRRKNALELLQEDIREMFISEGVLTATGKRMCRMMKEHQESGFISSSNADQQKDATESEEETPLVKRKEKQKATKSQERSPEAVKQQQQRATRKSPRVILEKIEMTKTDQSDKESGDEDEETPEIKKPTVVVPVRRTRRSNTISGEFLELDENGVVAKVQDKKKKQKPSTTDETDTSFEDDIIVKSDPNLLAKQAETLEVIEGEAKQPVVKKKKIRRRGRGGWATGVIKNKKKKANKSLMEKNPDSPALTVSTEADDHPDSGFDAEDPKNKPDAYDEEYSLLKVDVNEDVNYYLDNGNKFNCKLCDYKGKLIVHHYRSKHPESENMISRLSPEQASAAKIESNEFNFEEIVPYEEATRGKKRRTTFICRFCLLTFKQEFTCSFFDHICCHTGEYRYRCEKCTFSTGVKKTLSTHCHSLHPEMEKPLIIKPIYEGPPNFRLVFGYLCSACNFTQLLKPNVEKHIRVSHPDQDITIIKISMSTKPIPLTDLKKPEEVVEEPQLEANETADETTTTPESPEQKKSEPPKSTPKKSAKAKPDAGGEEPEPPALQKEKEPNLTVFMVPEEISQQEKLIESERLKKMEEIQSNVVPRRPKLQFVDKLKNKLDSVESEIALLESMEAENAAIEEAAAAAAAAAKTAEVTEAVCTETPEDFVAPEPPPPPPETSDKPTDGWISIASTCSLANDEQLFNEEEEEEEEPPNEAFGANSSDELENEEPLNSLNLSPSALGQNAKKTGFLDTIQRLAAQLQNNKAPAPSTLSDGEDTERLYYSPELTPDNSPQRRAAQQHEAQENEEIGEAIKLNVGSIEVQFFTNKNVYSCLVPGCYYTSNLKTNFRKHLIDAHKSLRVNCGLCTNKNDYMEWDLCGLFLHMLDQHKPETPVKETPQQIKQEPVDDEQPEVAIKTEILSPEKQPETQQQAAAGSIRLRRISGDILSSFSSDNSIEYPTISIPENVATEPVLAQPEETQNEPGFLQISNVRTLTPEEENHLQIKTITTPPKQPVKEAAAAPQIAFKKIIPKAYILNMGDLATSGVTKIVNTTGSTINLKRAAAAAITGGANTDRTTYNFTLKSKNETTTSSSPPTLVTKTIRSENKPTKTIIFRKTTTTSPPFLPLDAVPKLTLLKSPNNTAVLPKGFLKSTINPARQIKFIAPTVTTLVKTTPAGGEQSQKPLRLNKSEFILSIMMEYPKILDFYKCPCAGCIFSTNDRTKFDEHFSAHNCTQPGKYCVYCLSTVPPTDLIEHLERKHGNCVYQCALCFYRACFDMYMTVHQSFSHQLDIPKFYTARTIPNLGGNAAGTEDGLLLRSDAILPYYCTLGGCNRTFYTMNDFRVHMKIFHKRNNVCSICKFELDNAELLVGHYVTHNIANFQCRYCKFGSERPPIMLKHYAMEHYNRNPIVYKREYKTGTMVAHPNETAKLEDIVEVNLSYLVKTHRFEPEEPLETQNHIPAAPAAAAAMMTTFHEETNDDAANEELPASAAPEITKESSEDLLIDPTTGELIPATAEKQTIDGFREPVITLKHRSEYSLKAIADAVDPLTIDGESQETDEQTEQSEQSEKPEESEQSEQTDQNEDQTEPEEYYEDSGLSGCELYVCGTSECNAKLSNLKDFKDHMYSCDVLTNDVGWYTCFHCKKRFKYVGALIKHLTVHGPQKYTCSLCPAKAHLETLIIKHMKIQHKIPLAKVAPIDKTNPDSDYVAVAIKPRANKQKSKKDDELYEKELQDAIKHTREQIELIQNDSMKTVKSSPKCDDKNSFGPEDIDKLPRPPIFAQDIRCKVCSYNTKVRSNMLKHLKAHIENKPVGETAPVNPVPCLEKNELMFDKMTNLAASSHTGGRMGAKKEDKAKPPIQMDYPGFIAASKRFVCGSNGCNYLTHGDSMLRHHLTALHIDEPHYKCPHCHLELAPDGLNVLAVDNILFHLKMHDLHLYKCNDCQFYHYQKHKIERHLTEQHATTKTTFTTIRELDNSANLEEVLVVRSTPTTPTKTTINSPEKPTHPETDDAQQQPWRCGFCDFKTATRTAIQAHAANIHKIRSQFKCGSCEFRCSARNNYQTHYKNKHPNEKVVIMSVYYKITDESQTNSSSTETEVVTTGPKSFDTTPLWTKNKTGVKHIRGILLDDAPMAKRPKIIEKLAETGADSIEDEVKLKRSPQKSNESGHNLRFPATYGTNRNKFYVCPTCNTFETKNVKQFVVHLYKEINYFRYMCNFCTNKSTHMAEAQKHFKESHSTENIVNNKQICTVLRYFAKAEKWVEKCLQVQQEGIQKYETEHIKQENANSSTETLLLQIDEPEVEGETPEKPELTPQQQQEQQQQYRRSSRSTIKPNLNLNESFESNESSINDELSPPVLEPQVTTAPKKAAVGYKCDHCPFVAKAPTNLQKHVKKHFESKPYKCGLCSYVGSQLAHLQSHFYFKHTSEPLQYTMDPLTVVQAAQSRPLKRKRTNSETGERPTPVLDEPITAKGVVKAEPQPTNEISAQPTPHPLNIKTEPQQTDSVNFYLCYHCPRRSPILDRIREHFFAAHEKIYKNLFKYKKLTIDKPKKTKYSCPYCDWTGHPDGLKQHHLVRHIDKEYACAKDILLKCEVCTEVFNKIGLLKKHFTRNHPNHNLIYQSVTKENDDEYIETIEVVEEVLQVKIEKPAQEINCAYCVLSFADGTALRAHHDLVHSHLAFNDATDDQMKKYKCPQCEHTSNSFPAMRDHLRNHNKPYKCGHCDLTASYPNVLKTHHMKEHRNMEPSVLIINEAQKRNEELRDNLMHLQNGEYVKMKENLKRQNSETNAADEPPMKLLILDEDHKRGKPKQRRKSTATVVKLEVNTIDPPRKINVARKSTATPPRLQQVAKKSTTPRPPVDLAFSYYGTKPLQFDDIKNIKTELPIMGKNVPLNIGSMSQILQLFPVVVLDDIDKTTPNI